MEHVLLLAQWTLLERVSGDTHGQTKTARTEK